MFYTLKKHLFFWIFAFILVSSIASIMKETGSARAGFYGAASIQVSSTADNSAPLAQCKQIAEDTMERFAQFLDNFDKLVIHTDKTKRRGLSNGYIVYARCLEDETEFRNVLIHELGHVADIGHINGTRASSNSKFMDFDTPVKADDLSVAYYSISWLDSETHRTAVETADFASEYASTDPFEDFAEAFLMYTEYGEMFRYMAFEEGNTALKKKYYFIKHFVFDGEEFNLDKKPGLKAYRLMTRDKNPVFDMTKMHNLI